MDRRLGVLLQIDQPVDLGLSLEGGQAFRWRKEDDWYWGVLGRGLMGLRQADHALELQAAGSSPLGGEVQVLRRYLRLDDDLPWTYRALGRDSVMAQAIQANWGLRLLRQDPWECLASFICSIDSNIPRIIGTVERLAQALGEPFSTPRGQAYAFPTPGAVAEAGEEALRRLGLGFRAPYLSRTALRVAGGELDWEQLKSLPYEEAKRQLLDLPGVGDKVADCVLAFALDKGEAFPIDRWVRRALIEDYLGGQRWTDRALRQWAQERFGPLGAYAQQYLFQWKRARGS